MFQFIYKKKIRKSYYEYRKQFNLDIIDIEPKFISDSSGEMAYTDNEELVDCIKQNKSVTLYCNKRLFKCQPTYINAILYHEFVHISDCYNFFDCDNPNILMSAYSEANAKKMEYLVQCNNRAVELDYEICGEDGMTTPRKEIEEYLNIIISIADLKVPIPEDKIADIGCMFTKSFSYMFGLLSFYETSEPEYFQGCFDRMDESYGSLAKRLYQEIQDVNNIKKNPSRVVEMVTNLVIICVLSK